jgi:hypothetical integral membrane protein (TIGR02206 family)
VARGAKLAGEESMGPYPTPVAYASFVGGAALATCVAVRFARAHPGRLADRVAKVTALVLLAKGGLWVYLFDVRTPFTWANGLPLQLCDFAVFLAAAACWWQVPLLAEILWFWALAGTAQAVLTPELFVGFPSLLFASYLVGHLAIVGAAFVLTVGLGLTPRRRAVPRVFATTVGYALVAGIVDWSAHADYLFLSSPPPTASLLSLLGPWPWYVASAAGVALVLFVALDMPFWARRRRAGRVRFHPADNAGGR